MTAICARLVELRNLHDAVAMVTGLHNPAVTRLKQTQAAAGDAVTQSLKKLTDLIRPPFQLMRKRLAGWAAEEGAFLPPLEVLLQDVAKLDEIEKSMVPHPRVPGVSLGNVWKASLIGGWIDKFLVAFRAPRVFDFEGRDPAYVVQAFVKLLPDVFEDDVLFRIALTLETSVVN